MDSVKNQILNKNQSAFTKKLKMVCGWGFQWNIDQKHMSKSTKMV